MAVRKGSMRERESEELEEYLEYLKQIEELEVRNLEKWCEEFEWENELNQLAFEQMMFERWLEDLANGRRFW